MEGKILSIKQHRLINDLTQEEMAAIMGISQGTYNQKELGKVKWQVSDVVAIGIHFNLDLNLLRELQQD